jgi:hypothetical protein
MPAPAITLNHPADGMKVTPRCDTDGRCWIEASGSISGDTDRNLLPYLLIAFDDGNLEKRYFVQCLVIREAATSWKADGYTPDPYSGAGSYLQVVLARDLLPWRRCADGLEWSEAHDEVRTVASSPPHRVTVR